MIEKARALPPFLLGLTLLGLTAIAASVNAGVLPDCLPTTDPAPAIQAQVEKLVTSAKLPWNPATPEQIRAAPCTRKSPYSDSEVESEIAKLVPAGDRKVSRDLFGLRIENESETLVNLLENLLRAGSTTPEILKDVKPAKNQKSFKSACTTVLCAVKDPALFGPKLGPRLLMMLGKFGFNGSHYATENTAAWRDHEIDDVLLALSDLPPSVLPAFKNRPLNHFARGYTEAGEDNSKGRKLVTVANSTITVFDAWDEEEPELRRKTLIHEVGHTLSQAFEIEKSKEWLQFSGWENTPVLDGVLNRDEWKASRSRAIPSAYAMKSPGEDFAESVAAYRYNPRLLKSISPGKYRMIKYAVFDGLEYTSPAACDSDHALSPKLVESIAPDATRLLSTPGKVAAALRSGAAAGCEDELSATFAPEGFLRASDLVRAQSCVARGLVAAGLDAQLHHPLQGNTEIDASTPVKNAIRSRLRLNDLPDGARAGMDRDVRNFYSQVFTAYIAKVIQGSYEFPSSASVKAEAERKDFCAHVFDKYAYQGMEKVMQGIPFTPDTLFAYRNAPFLTRLGREVCQDVLKSRPTALTRPEESAIRAAVESRIR